MGDFVIDTFLPISIVILVTIVIILGIHAILLTKGACDYYKSRINKALKFIKKEKLLPPDYQYDWDDYSWAFNSIANILRGKDNE